MGYPSWQKACGLGTSLVGVVGCGLGIWAAVQAAPVISNAFDDPMIDMNAQWLIKAALDIGIVGQVSGLVSCIAACACAVACTPCCLRKDDSDESAALLSNFSRLKPGNVSNV